MSDSGPALGFEPITLTPAERELMLEVRRFARAAPFAPSAQSPTRGGFDRDFSEDLARHGWAGMTIPARYGGSGAVRRRALPGRLRAPGGRGAARRALDGRPPDRAEPAAQRARVAARRAAAADRRWPLPDGGRVQRAGRRVGSRLGADPGQESARRMADHRPQDLDHGRGPRRLLRDPLPDERRRRPQARGAEPDHRAGRRAGADGRADRGHGRRAALQRGGHRRRVRPGRLAHRRGGHRLAAADRRARAGTVRAGTVPVDVPAA